MSLSTHVLDTVRGRPAAGVAIELRRDGEVVESVVTDDDGRARFGDPAAGEYELVFAIGDYFGEAPFLDRVPIRFRIADAGRALPRAAARLPLGLLHLPRS